MSNKYILTKQVDCLPAGTIGTLVAGDLFKPDNRIDCGDSSFSAFPVTPKDLMPISKDQAELAIAAALVDQYNLID